MTADNTIDSLRARVDSRCRIKLSLAASVPQARSLLGSLPGVSDVELHASPEEGVVDAILEADPHTDLRKALWAAASQAQIPLLELRQMTVTLEDLYMQLTGESEGGA